MTASGTHSVYSRVVALLLVLLAFAGCGGDDDQPEAETDRPQQTGETDGMAAYDVASGGFTISVPENWKAANIDEILDEDALEELRAEDPELARQVEQVAQPGSPVKFLALDPDIQDDFATNANVLVEEVPEGITRDQYFEASVDNITKAIGAPEQERVTLPGGESLRLAYEQDTGAVPTVAIVQYVLFEQGAGYVLTYTTLPDRSAEYAETFEASARTFALL
jgi:hypothetical protein